MWKCKYCEKEFNFGTVSSKANHSRWCEQNPRRDSYAMSGNINAIAAMQEKKRISGFTNQYTKAKLLGLPKPEFTYVKRPGHPCSDATKLKLSENRKLYLKNNPDKHPWKTRKSNISVPCEKVKEFLKENGINFIAEYSPNVGDRHFSIDIAMPDKMIALEINGNQHYERDGQLKPYYQTRENILKDHGWQVYQIHYSACFNLEKLKEFFDKLADSSSKVEFDYFNYKLLSSKKSICSCGQPMFKTAINCKKCYTKILNATAPKQITKPELETLLWQIPLVQIGKLYSVSGNSVKKWLIKYKITDRPKVGYFVSKEFLSKT